MRAKTLILLFVALGCGMIAAVAVSKVIMKDTAGPQEEATVEIFVALKDLPAARQISAENVKLEKWPRSRVPDGAMYKLEQLEEKYTKQTIFADEPILDRKISDSRASLSTTVPKGFRIFDIACKASYIKAGDHVDIIGTFQPGGRNSIPESRTVMRNVVVHGVNGNATREIEENGAPGVVRDTLFQLQVKDNQVEPLTLANSMGTLQLNLRPFSEDDANIEDNGEDFMKWLGERDEEIRQKEMLASSEATEEVFDPVIRQSMTIITPDGATTYEWIDDNDLPQAVGRDGSARSSESRTSRGPSGNVYSGYGGYSPTYPTSTDPTAAQEAGTSQTNSDSTDAGQALQEDLQGLN